MPKTKGATVELDVVKHGRSREAVGARLGLAREALGLSQVEFAETIDTHRNTYNQYEVGTNYPKITSANAMKDVHGLTLDWIYRGDVFGMPKEFLKAIQQIQDLRASRPKMDGPKLRVVD